MKAIEAFNSRDPAVTVSFQNSLLGRGVRGQLAFGVFRAQKRSTVAKGQRKRKFRREAYDGKQEALVYVDRLLTANDGLVDDWGWAKDSQQNYHDQVLYVDLPTGQCSFHSDHSSSAKAYGGKWDRSVESKDSILAYCDEVLTLPEIGMSNRDLMPIGSHIGKRIVDLDRDYVTWMLAWSGILNWPILREVLQHWMESSTCPSCKNPTESAWSRCDDCVNKFEFE